MAGFLTERFPDCVSFGSSGGPMYLTTVIELFSGHEQRQKDWAYPRHKYEVGYNARRLGEMNELIRYYQAAGGRLKGFRFWDHTDYTSALAPDIPITFLDQNLLPTPSDGRTQYQLTKTYFVAAEGQVRIITRPVPGTVIVAVNGAAVGFTVDDNTGVITLGAAPPAGATVSAGYEFDVPCRFESDVFNSAHESHDNLASDVTLIELREGPHVPLV